MGEYSNKKKNGKGRLIFSDKSFYEGTFKDDKFDGFGIYKNKEYIYEGQFLLGKKNGKGKINNFIKNYEYEGDFINDLRDGYGIEKYSDGSVYEGEFKSDLKEGKGKLIIKNKDKDIIEYIGQFKSNKINGKGIINWANGKQYYGEINNNEISGYGILKEGKTKYIGYFKNDKKNGYGCIFYLEQLFSIVGYWENNNIGGPAIIFSLKENSEKDNNDSENINKKIIIMKNGEIINNSIDEDEINKIKENEKFRQMNQLYLDKFFPQFKKNEIKEI